MSNDQLREILSQMAKFLESNATEEPPKRKPGRPKKGEQKASATDEIPPRTQRTIEFLENVQKAQNKRGRLGLYRLVHPNMSDDEKKNATHQDVAKMIALVKADPKQKWNLYRIDNR